MIEEVDGIKYRVERLGYLRGYKLKFGRDGVLVITLPKLVRKLYIYRILEKHKRWIRNRQNYNKKIVDNTCILKLCEPNFMYLLGAMYTITLEIDLKKKGLNVRDTLRKTINDKTIIIKVPERYISISDNTLLLEYQSKIITDLIQTFKKILMNYVEGYLLNQRLEAKFRFNNIKIKDVSSKWGSCSSKRNLNFNYKLIFCPREVVDYVIVHELCHLKEMNHSKRFWTLLKDLCPDYRAHEKWLRFYGEKYIKVQYKIL